MAWGLALVLLVVLAARALGWWSARMPARAPGLVDGALAPCPATPNCVCSEATHAADAPHYLAPLAPLLPPARWPAIVEAVRAAGGDVVTARDGYLHATFRTPLLGFVDDVELRLAADALHWRSASRVGYSDLGANRRRLESLRTRIMATPGTSPAPLQHEPRNDEPPADRAGEP